MSLSSYLDDRANPIGAFLRTRFARTASLTRQANQLLRAATCIQPAPVPAEPYPYGTIGEAIDYRIRYCFALTPTRATVAYAGARELAYTRMRDTSHPDTITYDATLRQLDAFFDAADALVARIHPVGRALPLEDERRLARVCFTLGLFEEAFRSPILAPEFASLIARWAYRHDSCSREGGERFVHELLALARDAWVDDLCQMAARFVACQRHLLGQPAILNPTFAGSRAIGGADADLIVDGCLIDIKSGRQPRIEPRELRQLAGYLLLDADDALCIRSAGIYKARYGVLVSWPIEEFVARLTGAATLPLAALRAEFRQLCRIPDASAPR
jgi:hypothetical protein